MKEKCIQCREPSDRGAYADQNIGAQALKVFRLGLSEPSCGCRSSLCPVSLAVSAAFKEQRRLRLDPRDEAFKSLKSSLATLLGSACTPEKH